MKEVRRVYRRIQSRDQDGRSSFATPRVMCKFKGQKAKLAVPE